ncbi:MAG: tRNA 2-thiouridine(34) synthase MnmA [Thermodesulfobacteriota bacterium]
MPGAPVAVAMSGGVDSSVTAALLVRRGLPVKGMFLHLGQPDADRQESRVAGIAVRLGIELEVLELADRFEVEVLSPFVAAYLAGRTPNPCTICNRRIKFGALLDRVRQLGCRFLATGHYARRLALPDGGIGLGQGRDIAKDQSYFLALLDQEQLAEVRFPLGRLTKAAVRRLAWSLGLAGLHGPESQDVCFLAGGAVEDLLTARPGAGRLAGEVVDRMGRVLGRHPGIHHFTVGQRRGLGIPDASPYYVLAIDADRDRVVVGKEADLWQQEVLVAPLSWVAGRPPALPLRCAARIRYRQRQAPATLYPVPGGLGGRLVFDQPQRAVTPGQYAVLYLGDLVLGGGEIVPPATG